MASGKPIVKAPHKILRAETREVPAGTILAPKIQRLIAVMKETLRHTPDGVGLAAPQLGESLRIFIVSEEAEEIDRSERKRWRKEKGEWQRNDEKPYEEREWKYYVFINPVVKKMSKRKLEGAEGCLSIPGKYGIVKRNEKITIAAYDEHGRKFTRGASKFFARVLQHELDHLEGILFIDKATRYLELKPKDET